MTADHQHIFSKDIIRLKKANLEDGTISVSGIMDEEKMQKG